MSITTTITKPLEAGYVQVDSTSKQGYKKYYKVPQKNAKVFANELKDNDKNMNLYSNIVFIASLITGIAVSAYFTRNMDSRIKQFLIQTASAVGLTTLTTLGMAKHAQNEYNALLKKNRAKEIFYHVA